MAVLSVGDPHGTGAWPECLVYVVGALVRFQTCNTFKTNLKHL